MNRTASLLVALFLFWLALSGIYTPFLVSVGFGSALAALYFSRRMDQASDAQGRPFKPRWRVMLAYWPWLGKEMLVSAWDVAKRILHPDLPISPTLKEFVPKQRTEFGLATHANSITLTPGTICIEAEPARFLVHALTPEGAESLADSEMDRRCAALEGK